MTKKSGEVNQSAIGLDTLAVPAQQRGHSKRVTKIMYPGRRYARWDMEIQLWHQGVERMANCPFVDAASFREGEQRHVRTLGTSKTLLDVAFEAFRQFGPHRQLPWSLPGTPLRSNRRNEAGPWPGNVPSAPRRQSPPALRRSL